MPIAPTQPMLAAVRELRHTLAHGDAEEIARALGKVADNPGAEFFGLESVVETLHSGRLRAESSTKVIRSYPRLHPFVRDMLKRDEGGDAPELFTMPMSFDRKASWKQMGLIVPDLEERGRLVAMRSAARFDNDPLEWPRLALLHWSESYRLEAVQRAVAMDASPAPLLFAFERGLPEAGVRERTWMASALGRALPGSLPELLGLANDAEPLVRRAALEVLCSAIPPWAWTEPRMVRKFYDEGTQALACEQGKSTEWVRLRREMERLASPTIEAAVASNDELTRILGCRIAIKSGLRTQRLEHVLATELANESPVARAWHELARDGCGLTAVAIFRRISPSSTQPLALPSDQESLNLLRAELRRLLPPSRADTSERMRAVELLAKYVPRELAADPDAGFLGQKLRDVQQFMAESAMDRAVEMMRLSYWAPPPEIEAEFRRTAHVTAPVLAGEWLLAQGEEFGGYHESMWSVYGALLSRLGTDSAGLLAIGGDLQWQLPLEHIDWCCVNAEAARMMVPCLTGIWRTHVLPEKAWILRECGWDDWTNPLHPDFAAPPSWTQKLVRAAGPSAAIFLRPGLDDALAIIRMRSCAAFEALEDADEETTNRITALLDDRDVWVRFFAAKALRVISGKRVELRSRAETMLRNY